MTDSPEKIWAMPNIDGKWRNGRCTDEHHKINNLTAPFLLEYTRSDMARAYLADYRAAYEESCEQKDELRAEVERLKAALERIEKINGVAHNYITCYDCRESSMIARAALEHKD
jgi:histidinol-phosphate/aromatic aminotransferase/cobyric acid decarboxylase-like protein